MVDGLSDEDEAIVDIKKFVAKEIATLKSNGNSLSNEKFEQLKTYIPEMAIGQSVNSLVQFQGQLKIDFVSVLQRFTCEKLISCF